MTEDRSSDRTIDEEIVNVELHEMIGFKFLLRERPTTSCRRVA